MNARSPGSIWHDRRGGTAIIVGAALPILLGMTAFAVDLGSAALETRALQGIADSAALAAASDPAHAQANAEAAVAAAHWSRSISVTVVNGGYSANASVSPAQRFVAGGSTSDAVKVTLATDSPAFFARLFGRQSIPISRTAIAAQQRLAAFSIGSRLASVNGGLVNGYLSALTGSTVSLSVADYDALAGANIDLFGYLDALKTSANLTAVDYQHVLDAQVTTAQALNAAAVATSDASAAAALRGLAAQAGNRSVSLGSLFNLGSFAGGSTGPAGMVKLNAMSTATAVLQLASPDRQVSFDAALGLPGIASSRITVAIGERPAQSPWIAITDTGTPIIRTAQARIYSDTTLSSTTLPGLSGLIAVKVPIFVELASAEGRLSSIDCGSAATRGVTVEARPNPGKAAIASVDTSRLNDFTTAIALSPARLVHTLLVDVNGSATIDTGAAEQWQSLRFTDSDIADATAKTVQSSTPVQGIASSLINQVALTVSVIGLPIPTAPLSSAVGTTLSGVAPALDSLLGVATGTLGVHYGEADVRVTGMRCGTAALVG